MNKKETLKMKAISLSEQVFQFLNDRESESPPSPTLETWLEDLKKITEFHHETMNQYSLEFASKVKEIRNQLADIGLRDNELDSIYKSSTNPIGIRRVAERIGALAEKAEKK